MSLCTCLAGGDSIGCPVHHVVVLPDHTEDDYVKCPVCGAPSPKGFYTSMNEDGHVKRTYASCGHKITWDEYQCMCSKSDSNVLQIERHPDCPLHGFAIRPEERVNHPSHYGGADNQYEAIKVIDAWDLDFSLGNAVKYICRAGKKGSTVEDLRKAAWYLNHAIEKAEAIEPV